MQAPEHLLAKMGAVLSTLPKPNTQTRPTRARLHCIRVQVGDYQQEIVLQRQHARKLAIHLSRWVRRHLPQQPWQVQLTDHATGQVVLAWQQQCGLARQPFGWLARAAQHSQPGSPGLRERSLPSHVRHPYLKP